MKKTMKRFGAAFLAIVLLICCSIGVLSVSAQDPKDEELKKQANTAMEAFENKMGEDAVYVGTSSAYDAYVALNKAMDQYFYGHYQGAPDPSALEAAIEALNEATEAMTKYEGYKAEAKGALDKSYSAGELFSGKNPTGSEEEPEIVTDIMSNVLATYGVGPDANAKDATENYQKVGTQYGEIVFLYDGVNEMAVPINMYFCRTLTGTHQVRNLLPDPDKTTDFELRHRWHGESTIAEYQKYASNTGIGFEYGDASHASTKSEYNSNYYQSNTLYYTGTLEDTEYTKTIDSISWIFEENNTRRKSFDMDTPIYIINYKALREKIADVTNDPQVHFRSVAQYKQGGLEKLIEAIEKAISYDPNSCFTDISEDGITDAFNTAKADIEEIMNTLQNLPGAEIGVDYSGLRTAIDSARDIYFEEWNEDDGASDPANGLNDKYCAEAWDTFAAAYAAACDLINNNYGDDAADVTNALTKAFAELTEHERGEASAIIIPEEGDYKDATCGDAGSGMKISTCPNCGETFIEEDKVEIEPTGQHTYKGEVTKEPTCGNKGETTYTCTVCGDSYTIEDVDATGEHKYEGNITLEPTCANKGKTTYTCSECGDSYTLEDIDATGKHKYESKVTLDPTCAEKG